MENEEYYANIVPFFHINARSILKPKTFYGQALENIKSKFGCRCRLLFGLVILCLWGGSDVDELPRRQSMTSLKVFNWKLWGWKLAHSGHCQKHGSLGLLEEAQRWFSENRHLILMNDHKTHQPLCIRSRKRAIDWWQCQAPCICIAPETQLGRSCWKWT